MVNLMGKVNALFIVEGENAEPKLIRRLFRICSNDLVYSIHSYKTNLHVLCKLFSTVYPNFEEDGLEICPVLRERTTDSEEKKILSQKYTDIFLIFDLDPHDSQASFDTIYRMLNYFDDSTNHGKLFINYPMLESYKHLLKMPDENFKLRSVSYSECRNYKSIVNKEGNYCNLRKYDYSIIMSIIIHHLKKANYILNESFKVPEVKDYLCWDYRDLYDKQLEHLCIENSIYILNTCVFALIDYAPNKFFAEHENRKKELYI